MSVKFWGLALVVIAYGISTAATISYLEDTADIANPERGFYEQGSIWPANGLRASWFNNDEKITVFRVYCRIDSFRTKPLPQFVLDTLNASFTRAREAGVKIIPRFAYNFGDAPDAEESRILSHIDQLAPVLRANYDVIAFMEAGFIGYWGEWHSSTNGLDNTTSRRTILMRLLSALPTERMVALRYSKHKVAIFETKTPLSSDSGFTGSNRARVGAHNDCLGASAGDWGTYPTDSIEYYKNYLNLDNRFVPQGGETCNPSTYSDCAHMVPDHIRMRWDVSNIGYHQDVLNGWKTQGCYDDVKKKLGYRFRLVKATIADSVRPGGNLFATIRLVNDGYGKAYNPRGLELVLRSSGPVRKTIFPIKADPRRWLSGDTIVVAVTATLPATFALGRYEMFLNLPDTIGRLYNRPEYSIRLANINAWEDSTGYNRLQHSVVVSGAVTSNSPIEQTRSIAKQISPQTAKRYAIDGRLISDVKDKSNNITIEMRPTEGRLEINISGINRGK